MAHGQCLKCKVYGLIECHHPLPQRWYGCGRWTEPLCCKCHRRADNITLDIDADYGITDSHKGQKFADVFTEAFVLFMNEKF